MDIKGFTYGYGAGKGMFTKPEAELRHWAETGSHWL